MHEQDSMGGRVKPYYEHAGVTIYHADLRTPDGLALVAGLALHAVVTDPPYELGFMGKSWDRTGIAYHVPMWQACLSAMRPSAHLLSFGGSRTYHRMTAAIEDAGFEVRDQIMWLYGSGFPKSLDVSKAIDKASGTERRLTKPGLVQRDGYGEDWDTGSSHTRPRFDEPATEAARQWSGWGTALKPAHEPICVARKPLEGTVAANVLKHGTGAINVDACRVGTEERSASFTSFAPCHGNALGAPGTAEARRGTQGEPKTYVGRFPANVIHDGSDEVLEEFAKYGESSSGVNRAERGSGGIWSASSGLPCGPQHGDSGTAARFFYSAKASGDDRAHGNDHPTVKPLALMKYLCQLVSPPGSLILDPFCGSGSTLVAAKTLGNRAIGIDIEERHCEIAAKRLCQDVLFATELTA